MPNCVLNPGSRTLEALLLSHVVYCCLASSLALLSFAFQHILNSLLSFHKIE